MKQIKKLIPLLLLLSIVLSLFGCVKKSDNSPTKEALSTEVKAESNKAEKPESKGEQKKVEHSVEQGNAYYSHREVAEYIHLFSELPPNYLTKREAQDLGWESAEGNLWKVTDRGVIGGDKFGNREKKLPIVEGRKYFECDVNYEGGRRGAERLIYSNDGYIYYTKDHYNTFEELYSGRER